MEEDQNFLKVKRSLVTIFLFIFCISYSFAENLNFKKIVNKVNKIPTNETYFFTYIGVEIVIVQNNKTITVRSRASVGAITI